MKHRFTIKTIEETPSTSVMMKALEKQKLLTNGDVLRAINQTGGIGQSGNSWESEAGKNLTFSLFLDTHFLAASEVFQLNKIMSLALLDYLKNRQLSAVKIKWPNDVYIGDKKIAGVLTHNSFLGDKLENSIVGIGLNMNQIVFLSDAPNPVSLKQISKQEYNLEEELDSLLQCIYMRVIQLAKGELNNINAEYLKDLYGLNEKRQFKDEEGMFFGWIKGIDSFGQLLIEKDTKELVTYDVKTVEFL
jgi:BirA family biotin operon repressor/biotin-[acetyl-CoA-carboxylase] ligase